jgi:hypothetical protein
VACVAHTSSARREKLAFFETTGFEVAAPFVSGSLFSQNMRGGGPIGNPSSGPWRCVGAMRPETTDHGGPRQKIVSDSPCPPSPERPRLAQIGHLRPQASATRV